MVAIMPKLAPNSITPQQLRRLQTLWHRWMAPLELDRERDRRLRHAYIEIVTRGRARATRALSEADADLVIRRLARVVGGRVYRSRALAYVAGTAGRHEFAAHAEVRATPEALCLLDRHAARLGMTPARLDHFIAAHYGQLGLRRRSDLGTMADLNRVLWGLKALWRRRLRVRRAA